jgi:hypothetical protein
MVIGMGNNKAISTLKIMKIPAIRKNCDENGSRAEFFGSNVQSNGDLFSQSSLFFKIIVVNIIMVVDSIIVNVAFGVIIIIYLVFTNLLGGISNMRIDIYLPFHPVSDWIQREGFSARINTVSVMY